MSNHTYWPYDEVSFGLSPETRVLSCKAPWLKIEVAIDDSEFSTISLITEKFHSQTISGNDVALVHSLMDRFQKFPVSYLLPSPKKGNDIHASTGLLEKCPGLRQILARALRDESLTTTVDEVLSFLSRENFEWDAEAALNFASVNGQIHPESLFSVARRYHLIDTIQNDKGEAVFSHTESLTPQERKQIVAILVRQNHFVTSRCQESLLPALALAQSSRTEVEDFIRAENGHDRILAMALKEITDTPELLPVAPTTICLMNLLKLTASTNFLAFAIAVDFFERSTYQESDPLAQLLVNAGFEKAAKQIERHREINDVGEHENVACEFLKPMQLCSADYALEALRLAETVSLVMNQVTSSALAISKLK